MTEPDLDPPLGPVAERTVFALLSAEQLDVTGLVGRLADDRCGAVVTFTGVVRNHDGGRAVAGLRYEAHPTAEAVAREILQRLAHRHPAVRLGLAHRTGVVDIGEPALLAVVAAAHRRAALLAVDELVETVKAELPVWKHQTFTDGTSEWVGALGC